jgi:hypothetical protein
MYLITVDDSEPYDFHAYYNEYKRELLKLKLPAQEFAFSLHRLSMKEDTELALAYSHALRSAVVPTLSIDGLFQPVTRMYLDSAQMQHGLRVLHDQDKKAQEGVYKRFEQHSGDADGGASHFSPRMHSREIPIFLFYQDQRKPVFVDIHYQSRALKDMVIAVRSEGTWESVFACNGRPVTWNLENPLRPLLTATVSHLAGLLPMHVTYSEAHQRTSQNWQWSVGDSPLAYTSSRWHFNAFQADALHRNYVVGVLEQAHVRMAAAYRTLTSLQLTDANFAVLHSGSGMFKLLMRLWNEFYSSQADVVNYVDVMDYDAASQKLHRLSSLAVEIEKRSRLMNATFAQFRCHEFEEQAPATSATTDFLIFISTTVVVVLCVLCMRSSKKVKPKIN